MIHRCQDWTYEITNISSSLVCLAFFYQIEINQIPKRASFVSSYERNYVRS